MVDSEGVSTRASKRRRISAPIEQPKKHTRSRGRTSSPDELADDQKPPRLQRVTSVTVPPLQNVAEEDQPEPAAPSPAAPSPQPVPSPIHITPEKPLQQRLSPAAPSSYSPVTQYDEEEEEVDIVKAAEECNDVAKISHAERTLQEADPNAMHSRESVDYDVAMQEEEDNIIEREVEAERYDSPDELENNTTHIVHTFYRDPYNKSFSEKARRDSNDIKPSRSPSAPAYSRISTPLASPIPELPKQAVYVPYKLKMTLKGHKRGVAMVRVSPNGKLIASCGADATIRVWDSTTGKHLNTFEGHLAGLSTIAWAPDSKTIASGSDDKSIRLWDVPTGKANPYPLVGHHNYVYSIAFSPKGNILVSGSYDEAVFLWDVRTRQILRSLPAHSDPVGGVDFIRDGTLIVSCAGDGLIRIWDTGTGQCLRTLVHEDNAPVTSVRFSPNGKFVLAWTLDACVRLWDYVEGRCMKTYQGHTNGKYSLGGAFGVYGGLDDGTRERAFVVSGSEDGGISVWDVVSKERLQRVEGAHNGVVLGVDTWRGEGDKGWMVSCGVDKMVKIWEVEQFQAEEKEAEQAIAHGAEAMSEGEKMEGVEQEVAGESHAFLQVPVKDEHPLHPVSA